MIKENTQGKSSSAGSNIIVSVGCKEVVDNVPFLDRSSITATNSVFSGESSSDIIGTNSSCGINDETTVGRVATSILADVLLAVVAGVDLVKLHVAAYLKLHAVNGIVVCCNIIQFNVGVRN